MQTLPGMLAQTIHEDRVREYSHPSRRHAAELRRSRTPGESPLRILLAATIGRLGRSTATADVRCTTADGHEGRLVARAEGGQRVFVCEVG